MDEDSLKILAAVLSISFVTFFTSYSITSFFLANFPFTL